MKIKTILNKCKELFSVSFVLGDGFLYKIHVIFWYGWLMIRQRLGVGWGGIGHLKLIYKNKRFTFYSNNSTELAVLYEVFIMKEYYMVNSITPNTIVDLGSNVGVTALYFNAVYPNAIIYAFEPDPDTYKFLKLNTENFKNIKAVNAAVSDVDGNLKFYVYPNSSISSSTTQRINGQKHISVSSLTLQTIMNQFKLEHIDLLKFDVEGSEGVLFRSFDTSLITSFIGEFHADLAHISLEEFLANFPGRNMATKTISKTRSIVYTD